MPESRRILVIDDAGQQKWETVTYTCVDVKNEAVYITQEGLQYSRDALRRKHQHYLLDQLDDLCRTLMHPDIVIWDPSLPVQDTLLYYRYAYLRAIQRRLLICIVVKARVENKYLYNVFVQQSEKVKGYDTLPATAYHIWYIHPRRRPKEFGIRG